LKLRFRKMAYPPAGFHPGFNTSDQPQISRLPVNSEEIKFGDWTILYKKSHILASVCTTPDKCSQDENKLCQLCL
jgi:hypothetical protein